MAKKKPTVYDLLDEAEKIRETVYNKVLLLHKVRHDHNAVMRIANEIKELVK